MPSSSRVRRRLSFWMIPRNRSRRRSGRSRLLSRMSLNERIDAIGVRNSWLTWLRNSSFCELMARSCSLARARSATVASIWRDFASSSAE